MSLINDAIKRTQQTMQTNEPPHLDELELRPIAPLRTLPPNEGGGAKRLIWIVVLLVVSANIALWIVFKDRGNKTEVAARTAENAAVKPVEPTPVVEEPAPAPAELPTEAVASNSAASAAELEPPVIEPPVIERPEFRLKTIVTHPVRPSAMINNRVLFVGDRVEGYTVIAIGKDEVTLARDEDEVVVSLP